MAAHGWRLLWSSNSNCFGDDVSWSERDLWAKDVEMLEVGSPGREVVGGASGERGQEFCNSVLIHRDWSIENAHVDGLNRARCSRRRRGDRLHDLPSRLCDVYSHYLRLYLEESGQDK